MSKNSSNKILLPSEFFHTCNLKHLLLDTSFFIDAAISRQEFLRFRQQCRENNVTLVTIDPVVVEFTAGSQTSGIFTDKLSLIDEFVDYYLPLTPDIIKTHVPELVQRYKELGKGVSFTDYLLAGVTHKHFRDLYLLTKNPTDFPRRVFSLESYVLISGERHLHVYGVYQGKESN